MGYFIRLAVILMFITGVAAGSLALVNMKTRPIIVEYKRMQEAAARSEVMKEGVKHVPRDWASTLCDSLFHKSILLDSTISDSLLQDSALLHSKPYYEVYADEGETELIGYIFTAMGKGYSSTLETVTGVDTNFNIIGIKIISQQETPGLGAKCQEVSYGDKDSWFQRGFNKSYREKEGLGILSSLKVAVDKDEGEIHSITGATITTRAITNSIRETALQLDNILAKVELFKDKLEVNK